MRTEDERRLVMAEERVGGVMEGVQGEGAGLAGAEGSEGVDAAVVELRQAVAARTAERDAAQRDLLAAHRRALLAEHRGSVVEALVAGETVEALDASVARAREAYAQVAAQLHTEAAGGVPAGNPARAQ